MMRLCFSLCLVVGVGTPDAALEWKWNENDEFWVEYSNEVDEKIKARGAEQKKHESSSGVFRITVGKVTDGGPTLSVKIHKLEYSGGQPSPVADKMPGATFEVALDKKLAITGMSGLDKVAREVPGAATAGEARLKLLQTIAETMNRYWLSELLLAMPNKPTTPDEEWEQKSVMDIPPMGRVGMLRTLKDGGTEKNDGKDVRKIAVDLKYEWTPSPPEAGGLPFKVESVETKRSEGSTTALFDPEAGRLVKSSSKRKYTFAVKLAFGTAIQEIEIERDQTHQLRVLDKNPLK